MKLDCLEIGIIQAFLDGELSHDETNRVSEHIALCDNCASMLAEADEQSTVVFSALDREFNTLVPTQRLWSRINDSLQTERDNRPFWQKVYAFATMAFANPSIAAAASLVIVVGIFAAVLMNREPVVTEVAVLESTPKVTTVTMTVAPSVQSTQTGDQVVPARPATAFTVERASYRPQARRVATPKAIPAPASYLPGEESYVRTISSLAKTVEEQKEGGVLRPSQLIAYERDMAVVDDAIEKMKKEVRRNPRNESARQFLYATYQNKIDMLQSVSQKQDLMVSMR